MSISYTTINPATGEKLYTYNYLLENELNSALQLSNTAFCSWRLTSLSERLEKVKELKKVINSNREAIALQITNEMGKPFKNSIAEIEKCMRLCDFFCNNLSERMFTKKVGDQITENYISYEPLGAVFSIMPWNFPFWQALRCILPAICMGNVCLLKSAPNTFGSGEMLANQFLEAGFKKGVVQHIVISENQVEDVIKCDYVKGVAFTGSDKVGSIIAQLAGKYIKKSVLELGGVDPALVLADADIELAVNECVFSRFNNSGQTCIAAKRILIEDTIFDRFSALFIKRVKELKLGNPMDDNIDMGPLARKDLCDKVEQQVSILQEEQTVNVLPKRTNNYMSPGVFYISNPQLFKDEEIFGPVACLFKVKKDNIIDVANNSDYGLGVAIFSKNLENSTEKYIKRLNFGVVSINKMVKSVIDLPFGGVKKSGYGRELSTSSIYEFANTKSVIIAKTK